MCFWLSTEADWLFVLKIEISDELFGIISWNMTLFPGNSPELFILHATLLLHSLTIAYHSLTLMPPRSRKCVQNMSNIVVLMARARAKDFLTSQNMIKNKSTSTHNSSPSSFTPHQVAERIHSSHSDPFLNKMANLPVQAPAKTEENRKLANVCDVCRKKGMLPPLPSILRRLIAAQQICPPV